jgi:hypothetical protein
VQVAEPFGWPARKTDHQHDEDCNQQAVTTMLEVMDIVQKAGSRDRSTVHRGGPGVMNGGRWTEPHVQ